MSSTPLIAQSPFDDKEANIILRTCDNVDFYVYKEILKVASPFFRTLFSLPQAPQTRSSPDPATHNELSLEGVPIVHIPEDSEVFNYILRICYPLHSPERMQSLPIIEKALAASLKYEIDRATQSLKEDFRLLGTTKPMWMYMHACQLHLETEAQFAAQLLQKKYYPAGHSDPPSTDADFARIATELYSDDCGQLPARDLYNLLRHICFGDDLPLSSISTKQEPLHEQYHDRMLALEFPRLMEDLPADVLLQSCDGIMIPIHKVVLRLASATAILSRLDAGNCPAQDGIPVVSLTHPAQTVVRLFQACYFSFDSATTSHSADDDWSLFSVAQSYGMQGVADILKSRWLSHAYMSKSPFCIYLVASLSGWDDEAWHAARLLISNPASTPISVTSTPEMKIAGTIEHYFALLKSIHGINQVDTADMQTGTVFKRISAEEWKDPSYAYKRSISPMVAFRALQWYCAIDATTASVVDPPTMVGGVLSFAARPAEFVRWMVTYSEKYNEKRQEAILAMGTESTS